MIPLSTLVYLEEFRGPPRLDVVFVSLQGLSDRLANIAARWHEERVPFDGLDEVVGAGTGKGVRIVDGANARIDEVGEHIRNELSDALLGGVVLPFERLFEARKDEDGAVGQVSIDERPQLRRDKPESLVFARILEPRVQRIGNENRIRIEERAAGAGEVARAKVGGASEDEFGAGKARGEPVRLCSALSVKSPGLCVSESERILRAVLEIACSLTDRVAEALNGGELFG
jgi:hypothetical protein